MWIKRFVLRRPDEGGDAGVAGGAAGAPATPPAGGAPAGAPAGDAGSGGAAGGAAGGVAGTPPAGSGSAGDAGGAPAGGEAGKTNENYWPADWRDTVSKGDAKLLQRMGRYASPAAAMEALVAAQNRIAAGELKPVLGKNATPEQVKEYREALGIPETPDKYQLGTDVNIQGIEPKLLENVLKAAHDTNQTPEQVKATIKAWNAITQQFTADRTEKDLSVHKTSEDALRAEWGGEFRKNINLIHGMLDGAATPELKDKLLGGRLADGTPIGSSPEALKFLVGLALIQNPAGIVVPGAEANPMQGVDDELAKIDKVMKENRAAYNKDERMQARYRELLVAKEKLKPRASA